MHIYDKKNHSKWLRSTQLKFVLFYSNSKITLRNWIKIRNEKCLERKDPFYARQYCEIT